MVGVINSCPTAIRTVKESAQIIEKMGHKVVKLDYDLKNLYDRTVQVFT